MDDIALRYNPTNMANNDVKSFAMFMITPQPGKLKNMKPKIKSE